MRIENRGDGIALSIVIPTFNTAAMTLSAVRAALAAAPAASEVIVVDDASTDETSALLASDVPEARVVRLETNRRFAGAANAGVAASSGAIVLLLNSDALVERGALDALVSAFDADPRLGIAGAQLLNSDATPQWSGGRFPTLAWLVALAGGFAGVLPRRVRAIAGGGRVDWVSGAAMAFRREVWSAAGPLNERYRFYAQDLEFCARAAAAGWTIRIVDGARVVHGGGATLRRTRAVAQLPHDPSLLWLDLLTWSRSHHGAAWTTLARLLMGIAATLRVCGRRGRELGLRGEARQGSRSTTTAYVAALRQLFVEREQPPR